LWLGFTLSARLVWLVPFIVVVLGLEYNAIVKWEEELLAARLGTGYREYAARVPRWVPSLKPVVQPHDTATFPWRVTFFSERGTLIAIAVAYVLLWLRARF